MLRGICKFCTIFLGVCLGLLILPQILARIEPEHLVGRSVRKFAEQSQRESVQNVFDEMVMNKAELLRKSANICNFKDYSPHEYYVRMEYKHIKGNISSDILYYYVDSSELTKAAPLYIRFDIYDEAGEMVGGFNFAYYESVKKLYIYRGYAVGTKKDGTMSWEELEDYKDYFLYDVIIGSYLDNGMSWFSMDNLGEFEIIDYRMPYEYCGMPDREVERTEADEQGVSYTTWLETDRILCIQQTIQQEVQYDNERLIHMVLGNIPFMLTDEVFGRYTGASRFVVQIDGKDCELSDLIEINDDFIEWMKSSGQAEGNLLRISPDWKTGCRKTKKMLKNFPEEQMKTVLENCEFYIEPGYLHIRFPYWDYEAEEPAFVKNGNDLWRGWLTVKTDDIERFLKVEKW